MSSVDLFFAYSFVLQGAVFGDQEIPHVLEMKETCNSGDDWSSAKKVVVHEDSA